MDWESAFEVFCLVTGIAYLLLEIGQKSAMWYVGIITGAACAAVFGVEKLYASMALNAYYVGVSFYGLWQWKRDAAALRGASGADPGDAAGRTGDVAGADIHLRRPSVGLLAVSAAILVAGTALLWWILRLTGDSQSLLDAGVTVLSAVATWWLSRSVPHQWLLWIVADIFTAWMCARQGMYWMTGLYAVYAASAIYGWYHWKRKGQYI